jgi:hypothetical protein
LNPREEEEEEVAPSSSPPSAPPSEMKTTQERAAAGRSGNGDEEEEAGADASFLLAPDLARATMVAPTAAPARAAPTATIAIDLLSEFMLRFKALFALPLWELVAQVPETEREREEGRDWRNRWATESTGEGPLFWFEARPAFNLRASSFDSSCLLRRSGLVWTVEAPEAK